MRVDQSVHLMSEGGCVVLSGPVLTGQVHGVTPAGVPPVQVDHVVRGLGPRLDILPRNISQKNLPTP